MGEVISVRLHTGRQVYEPFLRAFVAELEDLINQTHPLAIIGSLELAQLAARYLAEGRTRDVGEDEVRQALIFGYRHFADVLMPGGGRVHSMRMDVVAAMLANPTDTSYDVLDPITGKLVAHRDLA